MQNELGETDSGEAINDETLNRRLYKALTETRKLVYYEKRFLDPAGVFLS